MCSACKGMILDVKHMLGTNNLTKHRLGENRYLLEVRSNEKKPQQQETQNIIIITKSVSSINKRCLESSCKIVWIRHRVMKSFTTRLRNSQA